ncbi:MAG: tetratricopeptide repeat protein [Gemmataceae bacterium]
MRLRLVVSLCLLMSLVPRARAGAKAPDKPSRIDGELKADDPRDPVTKNPRQVHSVKLRGGQLYDIRLDAVDKGLDPFLRVEDAVGKELGRDDDSGGDLNARLLFLAPKDGDYKLIATAYKGTGRYLLRVAESEETIHVVGKDGLKIEGKLNKTDPPLAILKGVPHRAFLVRLEAGQSYVFDLKSEEFDPFLIVQDLTGKVLGADDDGGEGLNSRLEWKAPAAGVYRAVVTTADGKGGRFALLARAGTAPAEAMLLREARDLYVQGHQLFKKARYREALEKLRTSLASRRKALGEEHPDTAASYNGVGICLHAQGKDAEAEEAFRKALAIRRKILGEEHVETAGSYNNVASVLDAQGKHAEAEEGYRKALTILRKVRGEEDPATLSAHNNLAYNLNARGKYAEAEQGFQKVLAIRRKVLGEEHPDTAASYNNLAGNLSGQGKYTEAEEAYRKALDIDRKVLGEEHPDTATCYSNVAMALHGQGRYAEAEEGLRRALAIRRKALGEEHASTAGSYSNIALNLDARSKHAEAEENNRKALALFRKLLGEEHPLTATSYANLAVNLNAEGKYAEAEEGQRRALAIRRKALGEEHPDTAASYNFLASDLRAQRKYGEAEANYRKALAIRRKLLGEEHPDTAASYNNEAANLNAQGKYAEAEEGYRKALAIRRKVLGEKHPTTASSYNNLALNFNAQGKCAEAEEGYRKALAIRSEAGGEQHPFTAVAYYNLAFTLNAEGKYAESEKFARMAADLFRATRGGLAATGLERAAAMTSPAPLHAALLARDGNVKQAWAAFEAHLGRGLWDDVSGRAARSPAELAKQADLNDQLIRVDQLVEKTFSGKESEAARKMRREELLSRRLKVQDELSDFNRAMEKKYGPIAGEIFDVAAIQTTLPADAALVGWLDLAAGPKTADPKGDHWAFLLRAKGAPVVVRVPGSGDKDAWLATDLSLPSDLRAALLSPATDWRPLAKRLFAQRFTRLAKHLAASGDLPMVRRLIVLPSPGLAGIPVEAFADGFIVSYAPSGTMYGYLQKRETEAASGLLVLADPIFERAKVDIKPAPAPLGGLLITHVGPGSNAALAGLASGDVLLRYADIGIGALDDLTKAIAAHEKDKRVEVVVWRDGISNTREVQPGKLGVVLAKAPAPIALAEKRKTDDWLAARGSRDDKWAALPGTRVEADRLTKLFGKESKVLMESDASEQALHDMATKGDLEKFRYIHLATHGTIDYRYPLRSAVILARDNLPDPGKQLDAGLPVFDGRLTAEKVLRDWKLNADLVTLSACETALAAKFEGGEGYVGFSQALILAGSRSVCLSLWKVDDTATALLMDRFYQNILGKRDGLKAPMGKAAALAEAKNWLGALSRSEALKRTADLLDGVPRGKHATGPLLLAPKTPRTPTAEDRPYAHPYYWAAFVLIGNPD